MTEQKHVWQPLKKGCPQVHWMRLENAVGTGMPDVNGCLNGVEAWIENKVTDGYAISFRPTQPAWIFQRVMHGGRVFILVRKKDTFYLYHGSQIRELVEQGLRLQPVLRMDKPFNWPLLLQTVFGHKATAMLEAA